VFLKQDFFMSNIYNTLVSNYSSAMDRANEYVAAAKKYVDDRLNDKVKDFIKKNKALLFFFSTVFFSYAITSNATFAYLSKTKISLHKIVLENFVIGSAILIIGNVLNYTEITNENDDRINYLAATVNLCSVYLSPIDAITTASAMLGLILSKTFYRNMFVFPPKKPKTKILTFVSHEVLDKIND
jgi:hypothetical protein